MLTDQDFIVISGHPTGRNTHVNRPVFAVPTARCVVPAAGTYYIDLSGLIKPAGVDMGLIVQSSDALSVRMTLAPASEVKLDEDGVPWHPAIAVPANALTPIVNEDGSPLFGSVLEVTSTGSARFYIGCL